MSQKKVNNALYKTTISIGASKPKQIIWYMVNSLFFKTSFNIVSSSKVFLLKSFGANVGTGVVIKPSVNIKYPWKLKIGNNSWIGEGAWIDNLADIVIGSNVTVSQGALLLTGSHDATQVSFDFIAQPIVLEDGVWIGAKAIVAAGVICRSHSILSIGSVAEKELAAYVVYKGNPAVPVITRVIH